MPTARRKRSATVAGALVVVLLAAVALYAALRHAAPSLLPGSSFCQASANGQVYSLGTGQAGIASTIAGVAQHEAMPPRAVTVAYATALQESKLENLHFGDRDSVGVFQQRPSEGWGTTRQLEDPVYATTKFFAALTAVPRYRRIPVSRAAQEVQHSADGSAYGQYTQMAASLASAFTGSAPHSVWCWFDGAANKTELTAAARELTRTFGPLDVHSAADPALAVHVRRVTDSWAVAGWLVAHSSQFGIREVRCHGYQWTAARGARGWIRERRHGQAPAPKGSVLVG